MVRLNHTLVKQKFDENKLKQEPFAERLGISVRHVHNICTKDMDVAVSLCYHLSKSFGIPMENLLTTAEAPEDANDTQN